MTEPGDQRTMLAEHPPESGLLSNARWMIRLRWIAGLVIVAGTLLGAAIGALTANAHYLAGIGIAVIFYNSLAAFLCRRQIITPQREQPFWVIQFIADMAALTAIIFFCGGVGSPIVLFYIVHMVCASILMRAKASYALATIVAALFCALVIVQTAYPPLYHPLAVGAHARSAVGAGDIALELGAFVVALYASVYLTTTVTRQLRAAQERASAHLDLLRAHNEKIVALNEALRRNEQEMVQPLKMASIGTMAAGMAHEVGNPLACLSALVQLLERRGPLPQEQVLLADMRDQVQRIALIVRQLLEFARPPTSDKVLSDVGELIEQTLQMVRYSSRSRHAEIQYRRRNDLPHVYLMPQQFQQVLVNALLNALDAVKGRDGVPVVLVEEAIHDDFFEVAVIDHGTGMTPEQVRRAFEPFYTTKPPGAGSGLGLAISYRLMQQQGGTITLQSTSGEGTTLALRLPLSDDARQAVVACADAASME